MFNQWILPGRNMAQFKFDLAYCAVRMLNRNLRSVIGTVWIRFCKSNSQFRFCSRSVKSLLNAPNLLVLSYLHFRTRTSFIALFSHSHLHFCTRTSLLAIAPPFSQSHLPSRNRTSLLALALPFSHSHFPSCASIIELWSENIMRHFYHLAIPLNWVKMEFKSRIALFAEQNPKNPTIPPLDPIES